MNPNQHSLYNHSYHIDLIKIIAMFMVVYYHVCFYKQDFGYVAGMDPYLPNIARMLMSICCAGVPFFFLCSGYCNQGKPWKGWKPLVKKVVTIAILTLFWNYVTPFPYWFFITLCGLYILTPMLKKVASQWPWLFWLGIGGIFLATMGINLLFLISRTCHINYDYHQQGLMTSYALVYYVLGAQMKKHPFPAWIFLLALVTGYVFLMWEMVVHTTADSVLFDGVNASFPTVGALLFSCGGMGLLMKLPLHGICLHKVLRFLASGCLVVYIFHLSVFKFLCNFLDVPKALGVGSGILLTLLVMAISFGMGWLLRQIPGVRMLVKI